MIIRIALFAVMALGLAGFGTVAWISFRPPIAPAAAVTRAAAPVQKTAVVAAARELRAGALLKPEDLTVREIPTSDMPADAMPDNPEARRGLIGAIVRRNLPAGQALIPADVLRPGDHGFLAAVLGPNQRAITVGVDVVSGTAGLIWPGDKVDLILTQTLEDPTRPLGRRVAAETVLADVRVIAIDRQLFQGVAPNSAADVPTARTVTLEVSAIQAERVSVATRLGRLSLVVRSAERSPELNAQSVQPGITWAGDVSPALGGSNAEAPPNVMRIFQGQSESKEFRF